MFDWLANPHRFSRLTGNLKLPLIILSTTMISLGLYYGLFDSPKDYQQGDAVRIMYVHVPSAWLASFLYFSLAISCIFYLVWKHPLADLIANAIAPIGLIFSVLTLITGSLWGKPMWGTWWAWDPRLTSFLVLFLFYLGYIALWSAIDNPDTAADLTSMLCIVGSVFAILSRYAVNFWNQGLHQGASLSLDKEKNVADVFYQPLLFSIFGFVFLFLTLVLIGTRTEIRLRRTEALRLRKDSE